MIMCKMDYLEKYALNQPQRSTRLVQLTDGWQYNKIMWLALGSVKSISVDFLNQEAMQFSSGVWVDPVPDLMHR